MKQSIKNQVVIITGGSQGYGKGIAKIFKSNGCKVWITARRESYLKNTAKELGVDYIQADISKHKDWDKIFNTIIKKEGKIDILINNAGAGIKMVNLEEFSDQEIENSINVNLTGHIIGSNKAVQHMKKQKSGMIINISSVCAENAWPGFAAYSAAKAGIIQFSKCLHTEVREFGIRIVTVIPSWGATNFSTAAGGKKDNSEIEKLMMQPEEMGEFILSLCKIPKHLTVPYVRIQPMIQEIIPM